MEKIKEIILAKVPDARIEENHYLTVSVNPDNLRLLAKTLRSEGFDFLIHLTGVDYTDSLGVVYLLSSSTDFNKYILMKTATQDRENPFLPTVSDIWGTANFNEREVFGFY